jgi:predicted Zn-dependent protease
MDRILHKKVKDSLMNKPLEAVKSEIASLGYTDPDQIIAQVREEELDSVQQTSVWAFVLALLFFMPFAPLVGFIMGIASLVKGKRYGSAPGLAIAAVIIGAVSTLIGIALAIGVGFFLLYHTTFDDFDGMSTVVSEYNSGDYRSAIDSADTYLEGRPQNEFTVEMHIYRAMAYQKLGENERAIQDYASVLPYIRNLSQVSQRDYSFVFFELGDLSRDKGNDEDAERYYREGLLLEPQSDVYQVMLGQVLEDTGKDALTHYEQLLSRGDVSPEERYILEEKIAKLGGKPILPKQPVLDKYYPYFKILLVPINNHDPSLPYDDLCLALYGRLGVECAVREAAVLDIQQKDGQYDADDILDELYGKYHSMRRLGTLIAITGTDITMNDTNYVYSLIGFEHSLGVVSSYRFNQTLPDVDEKHDVYFRRVLIQLMSASLQQMGVERASMPQCPTAYPNSQADFSLKGLTLCPQEKSQIDAMLANATSQMIPYPEADRQRIIAVYEKYHLD